MNCEGFISILADICTLLGFMLALYIFFQWKYQSNYSFKRDVIFKAEFSTLEVYASLITSLQSFGECKKIYLANGNIANPRYLIVDFKNIENKFNLNIESYHEDFVKLNLCKVNLDSKIILKKEEIIFKFEQYIDELQVANNLEDVNEKLKVIIFEIDLLSGNSIKFLSDTRRSI